MKNNSSLTFSIYQVFSNGKSFCIVGRAVKNYRSTHFFKGQRRWNHLLNVAKLYLSKNGTELSLASIKNGLYHHEGPSRIEPTLLPLETEELNIAQSIRTKKVIISDFDDTIIKSRATSITRLIYSTLFRPIGKREVFPEVSEVYEKLKTGQRAQEEEENNLFFYISSSTWNLYPLLKGFLKSSRLPEGILLLKEMDFGNDFESALKHSHKLSKIQYLLDFYPELPFILIGDAGQEDARIYTEIARKNPGRISKILIRYKWWERILEENPVEHIEVQDSSRAPTIKLTYFKNLNDLASEDLY